MSANHPRPITKSQRRSHLLDTVAAVRISVGDGLDDAEFTLLLRENSLLNEAGFAFLCFSKGLVTLTVREQDLTGWYLEEGSITEEEYVEQERAVLAELREIQNRRMQMAGVTPEEAERMGRPMLEIPVQIPQAKDE